MQKVLSEQDEITIIHAMGAYENLGRRLIMEKRGTLTKSQVDILLGLDLFGKLNMTQISEHLAASKEQASRAVAPLVDRGLVCRERNSENYRIIEIFLADKGKRFVKDVQQHLSQRLDECLKGLSEKDRAQLIEASCRACDVLVKLQKSTDECLAEAEQSDQVE